MNKGIELTPTQIKAYENGASMFLFPLSRQTIMKYKNLTIGEYKELLPIQKGDKDIFVQEEGIFTTYYRCYKIDADKNLRSDLTFEEKLEYSNINWQPASQMTKEQSRYSFSECVDIRVVRVQDIARKYEMLNIIGVSLSGDIYSEFINFYNQQMKEQNINRTYEDNDYVFLVEFKR